MEKIKIKKLPRIIYSITTKLIHFKKCAVSFRQKRHFSHMVLTIWPLKL